MSTPERRHQLAGDESAHQTALSIVRTQDTTSGLNPTFGDFYAITHAALISAELDLFDLGTANWRQTRDGGARKKDPVTAEPELEAYCGLDPPFNIIIRPQLGSLAITLCETKVINPHQQLYEVHAPEEFSGCQRLPMVAHTEPIRAWSTTSRKIDATVKTPPGVIGALHDTLAPHCVHDAAANKKLLTHIRLREQLNKILWPGQ